jgi:hypothetical protein
MLPIAVIDEFRMGRRPTDMDENLGGSFVVANAFTAERAVIAGEWSLAYIGTASSTVQRDELEHRSRRFRLGDKKEAACVCRGRVESMEIESKRAFNQ